MSNDTRNDTREALAAKCRKLVDRALQMRGNAAQEKRPEAYVPADGARAALLAAIDRLAALTEQPAAPTDRVRQLLRSLRAETENLHRLLEEVGAAALAEAPQGDSVERCGSPSGAASEGISPTQPVATGDALAVEAQPGAPGFEGGAAYERFTQEEARAAVQAIAEEALPEPDVLCDCGGNYYTADRMKKYATRAYAEGRADECEEWGSFMSALSTACRDACEVGDGFVNATDIRNLMDSWAPHHDDKEDA